MGGIAAETGELGALDGAVGEDGGEFRLLHFKDSVYGEVSHGVTHPEFADERFRYVAVVRAYILTGVAAEHTSAGIEIVGEISAVFYCEAGEAAATVNQAVGLQCS